MKAIFSEELVDLKASEIPFEHNYAQDIESLFWLVILVLFLNEDVHITEFSQI